MMNILSGGNAPGHPSGWTYDIVHVTLLLILLESQSG
jgi:hypothetical protein